MRLRFTLAIILANGTTDWRRFRFYDDAIEYARDRLTNPNGVAQVILRSESDNSMRTLFNSSWCAVSNAAAIKNQN